MVTGWASGIVIKETRRCGDSTRSMARSTFPTVKHLMQQSAYSWRQHLSVAIIMEIRLSFGIALMEIQNKSGQLVRRTQHQHRDRTQHQRRDRTQHQRRDRTRHRIQTNRLLGLSQLLVGKFNPPFPRFVLIPPVESLPMVPFFGHGTAMVVKRSSGPFRMASWCMCLTLRSVWICLVVIAPMVTGWASGIVIKETRRCGDSTRSMARSTFP